MRTRPNWAGVDWLQNNVLAGLGPVSECQRRTKPWELAASAGGPGRVRKVFRTAVGVCAAWVSGAGVPAEKPGARLVDALHFAEELSLGDEATGVSVPLFTSDPATGDWDALVLFRRNPK